MVGCFDTTPDIRRQTYHQSGIRFAKVQIEPALRRAIQGIAGAQIVD
jgi:hypothetical protein